MNSGVTLHPAKDRDMIDFDVTRSQKVLDVS
jgi:hypothetical protein